jgi:hypothetical protein
VPIGGFLSNAGFDRQTCAKNALAWLKATGRVVHLTGEDEITSNTGHVNPDCTGVVGTPCFTNITRIGSTATVHAPIFNITEAVWNQANGTGAAFLIKGAPTNTCLNGWQYLTRKTTTGSYTPDFDFTTACTGATTTYDATSDPGLTIQYLGVNPVNAVGGVYWIHACQLPKYVGNNGPNYIYQGWTSVNDGNGQSTADTSLSSLTSNGSLDDCGQRQSLDGWPVYSYSRGQHCCLERATRNPCRKRQHRDDANHGSVRFIYIHH